MTLERIFIRLSINDLYVIQSIITKTIEDAGEVGKVWDDYNIYTTAEDKKVDKLHKLKYKSSNKRIK